MMSKRDAWEFYVVLTNASKQPQPVFEYWNSWGFRAISFELTTADGKQFTLTAKNHDFDMNFPSRHVVDPGEYQVFPIHFDQTWQVQPALPSTDEMPITLKAIYSINPTAEATRFGVWTGRVESHSYILTLFRY